MKLNFVFLIVVLIIHLSQASEGDFQKYNNDSNFKIAIVVDMWITGFDVPSLAVMYIDKPIQKHTLIQTSSRNGAIWTF